MPQRVSGSRAITTRADLIIEGSDTKIPRYSAKGRTIRPAIDPIATPFCIELDHSDDEDDTRAATRLTYAANSGPGGKWGLRDQILGQLKKEPRTVNYLATATSRNAADVATAIQKLVESGAVVPAKATNNGRTYDGFGLAPDPDVQPDEPNPTEGPT